MSSIENNVECFVILLYCWVSFINIELEMKLMLKAGLDDGLR